MKVSGRGLTLAGFCQEQHASIGTGDGHEKTDALPRQHNEETSW